MRRLASCAQLLLRSGCRRLVIDSLVRIVVLCECAACHSLARNICASLTKKKVIQQCQHVPAIIITTPSAECVLGIMSCVCVCVRVCCWSACSRHTKLVDRVHSASIHKQRCPDAAYSECGVCVCVLHRSTAILRTTLLS